MQCLESALRLHGIVSAESDVVWMAIDHKARKPVLTGLNTRFAMANVAPAWKIMEALDEDVRVKGRSS